MKHIDILAAVLLVIGGLNWGLWGLFDFDLIAVLFDGNNSTAARVVYILVGAAAVFQITNLKRIQKRWNVATA